MQFGLSESQEFLKDSAHKFFAGECPSAEMRRLMETETAYDAALWSKLTDQGYTGITYAEEYDGVGLGKVELMLLMEEAGRALLPGPFFSTVVLAGSVLDAVGSPAHKKRYLSPICRGEARATVAILESSASWNLRDVQLTAANGKLTGEKLFVSDAGVADFILVVARNGVFIVDAKANGLKICANVGHGPYPQALRRRIQRHARRAPGADHQSSARLRHCERGLGCGISRWHATHSGPNRRVRQNSQTIRQTHWDVSGRAASMRRHVP